MSIRQMEITTKIDSSGRIAVPAMMRKALNVSLEQEISLQYDQNANRLIIRPLAKVAP